jgi:DNA-binding NarL/FixJ family response regulator
VADQIYVLIVEDDAIHATKLHVSLRRHQRFKVDMRLDGRAGVEAVKDFEEAHRSDEAAVMIVLMDLDLGPASINGNQAARKICDYMEIARDKGSHARVEVLAVTYYPSNVEIINTFHIGMNGCVLKKDLFDITRDHSYDWNSFAKRGSDTIIDSNIDKLLVPRIEALANGSVGAGGGNGVDLWSGLLPDDDRTFRPTRREWQVAMLVARGLTDKEIAKKLNIAESVVRRHEQSFRQKLGLRNRAEIVAYILNNNLLDPDEPDDL